MPIHILARGHATIYLVTVTYLASLNKCPQTQAWHAWASHWSRIELVFEHKSKEACDVFTCWHVFSVAHKLVPNGCVYAALCTTAYLSWVVSQLWPFSYIANTTSTSTSVIFACTAYLSRTHSQACRGYPSLCKDLWTFAKPRQACKRSIQYSLLPVSVKWDYFCILPMMITWGDFP